ncbi:uncharacterized protein [Procambarus clarkii]|uniref:uncharacterized protein n=1 Tax=Procambarus clarkii TaxID=6728 RepID=UPI00374468CC
MSAPTPPRAPKPRLRRLLLLLELREGMLGAEADFLTVGLPQSPDVEGPLSSCCETCCHLPRRVAEAAKPRLVPPSLLVLGSSTLLISERMSLKPEKDLSHVLSLNKLASGDINDGGGDNGVDPGRRDRPVNKCRIIQSSIKPMCEDLTYSALIVQDNKPEECSVCYNDYDDNQLRPRNLPCGHTFCSQCIDNAIKNGQLTCPSCRVQHAATAATQFPISYAVEAFVRKLKNIQLTTQEAVPAKPYEGPARGISKKLRSLVQEQKSIISCLIISCEEVLSQLGEYRGQLGDWKTHHLQLQDRLYALVEQNKSAMKLLELEDTSVVDMTTQGEEGKTQLQAMLGNLDTVNTPQEVDTTIDTADECSTKIKDWLEKCQELFPDVKTVHTSVKVQETIREALEMMTTETGATADPVHLGDSASSIMNKVQEITGQIPQKQLTVEDLRRMREPVKRLVEAGRVLAVQEDQDGRRSARITLQDGQLYLHSLLRQPTPAHAHTHTHTLQESEVVGVLEPSCTLAFLDLGWAGSTRGRVTIRLTPDTPLARQFVLLCTGQRDHTYRNTKLLQVWGKGQPGERVGGGDYESNDGEGGAPLLPFLQGQYRESGRAGAVWSRYVLGGPRSAQFAIITRDLQGGHQWPYVFGDVVSGLDVVRAAVNHSDITEVTVVDCGVVLPL